MWRRLLDKALAAPRPTLAEEGDANPAGPEDPSVGKPVQFEQLSREWTQVSSQENFDGFRIEAGKMATKHLQTSHSLYLGTSLRSDGYIYQFGPSFMSADHRTQLMGKYDLEGQRHARFSHRVSDSLELSGASMTHVREDGMHEVKAEVTGSDWTGSLKVAHQGMLVLGAAFTQELTKRLTVGSDLMWFADERAHNASMGNVALRYCQGKDIFFLNFARNPDFSKMAPSPPRVMGGPPPPPQASHVLHSLKMSYYRKISDRLSMGSELELEPGSGKSGMKYAYEYTYRHARVQGSIDSAGKVACFVQDFQGFGFSGTADFVKNKYQFGFLFNVVPPPEDMAKQQ